MHNDPRVDWAIPVGPVLTSTGPFSTPCPLPIVAIRFVGAGENKKLFGNKWYQVTTAVQKVKSSKSENRSGNK
jgi:hypothetical protein